MSKVLFIGRFQPFHLGHLSVIDKIDERVDVQKIIVAIGSAQLSGTTDNPYNIDLRRKMVDSVLSGRLTHPYQIIAVPDVNNNETWVSQVEQTAGDFTEIYTGNQLVKTLFTDRGYKVSPVVQKLDITATKIREIMERGDYTWRSMVPVAVADLINEYVRDN